MSYIQNIYATNSQKDIGVIIRKVETLQQKSQIVAKQIVSLQAEKDYSETISEQNSIDGNNENDQIKTHIF